MGGASSAAASDSSSGSSLTTSGYLPVEYHPSAGTGGGYGGASAQPYEPLSTRNIVKPFQYMFTTLKERADNLEGRLDEMAVAMVAAYNLGELVAPVGTVANHPIVCIGRIVVASETGEGKINRTSVLLEGSRDDATATGTFGRIALDLSEMPGFSLFPGQVVAVKGICNRSDRMVVQAIYHGLPPPPAALPVHNARALCDSAFATGSGPLRVWVACGPFCIGADLEWSPLTDLLAEAQDPDAPPPDVIILMGPFLDADHPRVKSGDLMIQTDDGQVHCLTPQEVWEGKVAPLIEDALATKALAHTHLVIQSAWTDFNGHPIIPGWPLLDADTECFENESVRKRVTVVSNPATFTIGGLTFASTSTDIIHTLNRDEVTVSKPTVPGGGRKVDKLARLAQHMLEQRSFLPMFPLPSSETEGSLPLELNQLWHLGLPVCPDILIAPSKLKVFSKPVGPTLMINPGNLCRGNIGGTYARLTVFPQTAESIRTVKPGPVDEVDPSTPGMEYALADVPLRTRVEILRI